MTEKRKTLSTVYIVVGILSIIFSLITLWEYARGYGYLDPILIVIVTLGIVTGILLILAYNSVSKNREFVGLAATGCVLGLVSSFWVILGWLALWAGGFSVQADILIFVLYWGLSIIYIVVLVLTLVLTKYE